MVSCIRPAYKQLKNATMDSQQVRNEVGRTEMAGTRHRMPSPMARCSFNEPLVSPVLSSGCHPAESHTLMYKVGQQSILSG